MRFANQAQYDAFVQQYGQAAAAGGRPQNRSTMQQQTMPAGGGGALPRPPGTTDAQYQSMLNASPPRPGTAGNSPYDQVRTQSAVQTPRQQMEQRDRLRAQDRADSAGQRSQSIFSRPGIDLQRRGSPLPSQQPMPLAMSAGVRQQSQPAMAKCGKVAKYAKGGSVRGAGCETRGLRKARIY